MITLRLKIKAPHWRQRNVCVLVTLARMFRRRVKYPGKQAVKSARAPFSKQSLLFDMVAHRKVRISLYIKQRSTFYRDKITVNANLCLSIDGGNLYMNETKRVLGLKPEHKLLNKRKHRASVYNFQNLQRNPRKRDYCDIF